MFGLLRTQTVRVVRGLADRVQERLEKAAEGRDEAPRSASTLTSLVVEVFNLLGTAVGYRDEEEPR